jgi:hypothetical protein
MLIPPRLKIQFAQPARIEFGLSPLQVNNR